MTESQPVLSITDTAIYLGGLSRATVYRMIEDGKLQRVKVGGRAMITRASIDAYLNGLIPGPADDE